MKFPKWLGHGRDSETPQESVGSDFRSYADAGLRRLMNRWYVPGWWRGLGWWNTANALETVIDYSFERPMGRVNEVIQDLYGKRRNEGLGNFINDNVYDDEAWWALSWTRAYDLTRDQEYLDVAETIFSDMITGWDETCSGGVFWDKARRQKNAIENELFITLAARLHIRTREDAYLEWARRAWTWFEGTGMQGPSGLVNDGVDLRTCRNNRGTAWTYNQGVILGGLTDLCTITGNLNYSTKAREIATAAMTLLVDGRGVLTEPCESSPGGCGADGPQFKGIFMRYLSYLYRWENSRSVGRDDDFISRCESFFATQARSIWNNARDEDNTFGLRWGGPPGGADASTQSSALDALVAAIPLQGK